MTNNAAKTLHWLVSQDSQGRKKWTLAGYGHSCAATVFRYTGDPPGSLPHTARQWMASVADFGVSTWGLFKSPGRARVFCERKLAAKGFGAFEGWSIAP